MNIPADELEILKAYLIEGLSMREIQKEIIGVDAPAHGGGFLAMEILHKYNVKGEQKGILKNVKNELEIIEYIKDFGDQQVTDIQKYIIEILLNQIIKSDTRIEYGKLSQILEEKYNVTINPHTVLPVIIGDISKLCHQLGLPMLSMIVVNKNTQLPGEGFYKLYDELHNTNICGNKFFEDKIRKQIKEDLLNCNNWNKLTDHLGLSVEGITSDFESIFPEEIEKEKFQEGSVKSVLVNKYERNPVAKRKCIEHFGTQCQICGFKFSEKYGEKFKNKIHVHHKKPLAEIGREYELDPINDLIPVCPNCHMILHSKGKSEVYSPEEVIQMLKDNACS